MSNHFDKLADALRWALPLMSTPTKHSRAVCPEYAEKWDAAHTALDEYDADLAANPAPAPVWMGVDLASGPDRTEYAEVPAPAADGAGELDEADDGYVPPPEGFELLLRAYEFAAYEHGKTGENAIAVDAAGSKLRAAIAALRQPVPDAVRADHFEQAIHETGSLDYGDIMSIMDRARVLALIDSQKVAQ